ncbi:heterokaryon incompatibility protein-domain-containing protein [Pyrenochaeta sp. MPI-SDFR-AT-0127]|nr:heterokaryon incompatibility protein-domain-containing protein [Pyrenochaeta sp. MPI-SDFR-AT-0127]
MFENVCAIPLEYDLFAQAIHPAEPVVAVGLASGHVHSYRLPQGASDDSDNDTTLASENGCGLVETVWKTRRHKGSCRTLAYSIDGTQLYSAGTDGIVKIADSSTGQVTAKIAVPQDPTHNGIDAPTLVHALSPQSLILTTDSSALHIYDIRHLGGNSPIKPENTHHPHDDYISSLTPLPPTHASTSGFSKQWVTTGGSTLAVTDLRRGVMVRSEDQDEELLTSLIVTGLSTKGTNVGEKVVVGAGNGVLTLWERGVWDDQDERIVIDRSKGGGESLDTIALLPDGVGPGGKIVAVGMGNGGVRFAKIGPNKIIGELKHDELSQEGVIGLGFDVTGRMISGGGKTVKIWGEQTWQDVDEDEEEKTTSTTTNGKRENESGSDDNSDEEIEESSEEEQKQKRKKRKRNKGKQQKGHDSCNCFYSALAKTSVFQAATAHGPIGIQGYMDEEAQAAIQEFVAQKKSLHRKEESQRFPTSSLYTPLDDGEIRILELHPGEHNDPFKGDLHIVSVDFSHPLRAEKNPSYPSKDQESGYTRHTNHAISISTEKPVWYTALSYVWGAPIFDQTIGFEQGSLNITGSLASALHRLRSNEHGVFLWIDQICINQLDIAEKVKQIPLMGAIYTKATNTIIWLGDDDSPDSSLAFDLMETVYARLQGSDAQITPADFERLDFPPALDRAWWAIRRLFQRPWFTRLWTIQEAFLSRNLFIESGHAVACWDDFAAWCYYFHESGLLQWLTTNEVLDREFAKPLTATPLPPQGATVVNSIQADRIHGLTLVQKEYLLNILVSTRYAQATEPKDKIFGVLGMAESTIIPDYSPTVSAREIYHKACLTQLPGTMYELLSCIDHDAPLQPSWIPDWSVPRVTEALGYSTKAWTVYRAGGVPDAMRQPKMTLSEDQKQITLSGKIFDRIVALGCVSHDATFDIDSPQVGNRELASYVEIVHNMTQGRTYPVSGVSVYDAFLQTLLAGRDNSGVAPPSHDHSEVFSLILDSMTGQMPSLPGQTYSIRRQKGFFSLNSLKSRKPAKTMEDLRAALRKALRMRRFAITGRGYFALVPRGTQEDDEVVVFDRACVPFVVRKRCNDAGIPLGYDLLGEAYVHGIMQGEVMQMDDVEMRDVTFV